MDSRLQPPEQHGQLVAEPDVKLWPAIARENSRIAAGWEFPIGGRSAASLRTQARRALTADAWSCSEQLGVRAPVPSGDPELILVTGHQPGFHHAGVWVKVFLMQQVARLTGATAIDVVVDSDTFDRVGVTLPWLAEGASRREHVLVPGGQDICLACADTPGSAAISDFCEAATGTLASLSDPAVTRRFAEFCRSLQAANEVSGTLAELLTTARRSYEGSATDYLELPVTVTSRSEPFVRFAVDILLDARRFAECHNEELAAYRVSHRVRSAAQPFPDLATVADRVELPFWLLDGGVRTPVYAHDTGTGVVLLGPDGVLLTLPRDPESGVRTFLESGVLLVPRALTLTLFYRTLLADLFIHGIGGSRYDRVTEGVARRWWGIELPQFVTASLAMHLSARGPDEAAERLSAVDERLHRLAHNPDEAVDEVEFDSAADRERASGLTATKRGLIGEIAVEGADRKALGARIREVNQELSVYLEPLVEEVRRERDILSGQVEIAAVLADRTYPFFLFSPQELIEVAERAVRE